MAIGLVPNIPNQLIDWRVEYIMNSHRHFYHPQTSTKMASIYRDVVYDELSELIAYLNQLGLIQFFKSAGESIFESSGPGFINIA